jgi:lycopene cyclase domain-containing protein
MNIAYLVALLFSIMGMAILDWRYKLFFWADWRRATIVMAAGLAFFLIWDVTGVNLHIFFPGDSSWDTGWMIAPGVPIEELFFLTLLCYLTMNVYALFGRLFRTDRGEGA